MADGLQPSLWAWCAEGGGVAILGAWPTPHQRRADEAGQMPPPPAARPISVFPYSQGHRLVAGVRPFNARVIAGELLPCPHEPLLGDAVPLLIAAEPGRSEPVAWARPYGRGRLVYTSLGHPADFRQGGFGRFLANAATWITSAARCDP